MESTDPVSVIILTSDLMTASRLVSTCEQCNQRCQQVTTFDAARDATQVHQPNWIVLDLETIPYSAEHIVSLRAAHGGLLRVIAFGPHVQEQRLEAARQAGCDLVWTRGQIHRDFASLIGG